MDVKLPNLGEGADSGVVVNLMVKEGDTIEKDQTIIELENEKAVAPIPSTTAGKVTKIYVKEGDKLSVGQRILAVSGDGEPAASETKGETRQKPETKAETADTEAEEPATAEEGEGEEEEEAEPASPQGAQAEPAAPPSIRKMARELGIDLTQVRGSQRGGRIVMADVRAYIQRLQKLAAQPKGASGGKTAPAPAPAPAEQIDFSQWGEVSKKPLTPLRKTISRRMSQNWNTIPHVTQFDEADITDLLALRKKFVSAYEEKGARLTLTSFVLQAVAATLKKHPIFNASLDEVAEEIVYKEYCHIGIAVDTDAGLIVPVIRDVDKKSLLDLSKELQELAEKARQRKVASEELKGGTFTISNQGGIGGAHFTPIVNKPEAAILGLGRGAWKALVKDKKIEPRMTMPLALSYDHRLIDGGSAARFITDLVGALEGYTEDQVKI